MVDQGIIAGCAGGGFENICAAADILKGSSIGSDASVFQIEDRQAVSVVITSMPIRKSALKFSTPGPTNSITLFLT